MSSEFEKYRVKRGDDLGSEEFWNDRLRALDARITANENKLIDVNKIAATMEKVALDRINSSVTPLVEDARARLASIPSLFSATSLSEVEVGEGEKAFVIEQAARQTWAVAKTVFVQRLDDNTVWMAGDFVSFDRDTGDLVIDVSDYAGAGTFDQWKFYIAGRRGPQGLVGVTPTLEIGEVEEGDEVGAEIDATDPQHPILNLTLVKGDQGDDGDQGDPGLIGVWRGAWGAGPTYALRDVVQDHGSAWISLQAGNTNHAPPILPTTSNAWWELVTAKGVDGSTGAAASDITYDHTASGLAASNVKTAIDEVNARIDTRVAQLVNSSPGTLDTLREIADAIGDDPNFAATITAALGVRLRVDAPQGLSSGQKTQARANLDLGALAIKSLVDDVALIQAGLITFDRLNAGAIASLSEAQNGAASNKLMTPERTYQAIVELSPHASELVGDTTIGAAVANIEHTFPVNTYSKIIVVVFGLSSSANWQKITGTLRTASATVLAADIDFGAGNRSAAAVMSGQFEFLCPPGAGSKLFTAQTFGATDENDVAEAKAYFAASNNSPTRVRIAFSGGNIDAGRILTYGVLL